MCSENIDIYKRISQQKSFYNVKLLQEKWHDETEKYLKILATKNTTAGYLPAKRSPKANRVNRSLPRVNTVRPVSD